MDRSDLLQQAEALINGSRATDYGSAQENFCRIKTGWNTIIQSALSTHGEINEGHVALMMSWVKIARLSQSIHHEDSWADLAGYAALGSELAPPKVYSRSGNEESPSSDVDLESV
tara:strand:- start:12 stop:356 length:345 start_codon:yes stop_codon:yes gene_type:complete